MDQSSRDRVFVTGAPSLRSSEQSHPDDVVRAATNGFGSAVQQGDAASPAVLTERAPRAFWRRPRVWKTVVSAWLFYHVFGLLVSPASISPSSDLQRDLWLVVGPYLQFVSMNQGNHFFAPDPGPSTLVRYIAVLKDGSEVSGHFPDRRLQKPRLLYHRHFMLTEQLAGFVDGVDFDEGASKRLLDLHSRAIARQVCLDHDADSVKLTRVTHRLREPAWAQAGMPLQHPENYEEHPLAEFNRADLQL